MKQEVQIRQANSALVRRSSVGSATYLRSGGRRSSATRRMRYAKCSSPTARRTAIRASCWKVRGPQSKRSTSACSSSTLSLRPFSPSLIAPAMFPPSICTSIIERRARRVSVRFASSKRIPFGHVSRRPKPRPNNCAAMLLRSGFQRRVACEKSIWRVKKLK